MGEEGWGGEKKKILGWRKRWEGKVIRDFTQPLISEKKKI